MTISEARHLLDLEFGATKAEVTAAWRRRIARAHPDVTGTGDHTMAAQLNQAYELLVRVSPDARGVTAPAPQSPATARFNADLEARVQRQASRPRRSLHVSPTAASVAAAAAVVSAAMTLAHTGPASVIVIAATVIAVFFSLIGQKTASVGFTVLATLAGFATALGTVPWFVPAAAVVLPASALIAVAGLRSHLTRAATA